MPSTLTPPSKVHILQVEEKVKPTYRRFVRIHVHDMITCIYIPFVLYISDMAIP